jgi:hypothetical protein
MKLGIHTTADWCSGKFASMKIKFNEINDLIPETNKGKRVQWPFFANEPSLRAGRFVNS